MADLKPLIGKCAGGQSLTREEARTAFDVLMSGEATPSQIGGLLMALRVRGETVDEITGAVEIMREKMLRVEAPPEAIDIVGTGGDASGSYNISTCAALIAAGAGLKVAKHGKGENIYLIRFHYLPPKKKPNRTSSRSDSTRRR